MGYTRSRILKLCVHRIGSCQGGPAISGMDTGVLWTNSMLTWLVFSLPPPHTYQEVCMNAYIMTLIQGKKFRTRKHSSEHIRRHHRQHRSDTRPRSQREHGSTWAENGGNNHQQRDELQKMAPVPAPSSQRSPVSGLRRAAKGGENAWGATVARGEAG